MTGRKGQRLEGRDVVESARPRGEGGAALLGALVIVSMLMLLGMLSLNMATQEIQSAGAATEEAAVGYLAEAGADLVMRWFHDPATVPGNVPATLFVKQYDLPGTGPSFFDAEGRSQFRGTAENPDFLLDASHIADDQVLNGSAISWLSGLHNLGRIMKVKAYGPTRPGLLGTVEVTAGRGELVKTVSVELGTHRIPPLHAGVQVGSGHVAAQGAQAGAPFHAWVHWGDVAVKGDVFLGTSDDIPLKSSLAPVTERSYGEGGPKEDRWLDLWVGGEALVTAAAGSTSADIPGNVYPLQDPIPGLKLDRWEYDAMKEAAQLFGSYYVLARDGLLYQGGNIRPGRGRAPDAIFGSELVGNHHGLVFVDTWDQRPPAPHNMSTLSLGSDYVEGLFVVNAHVSWNPRGPGRLVPALSPPVGGSASHASRIPVGLYGVNLNGVLYTPGNLTFTGDPRVYGAVVAGGTMTPGSQRTGPLELWYNDDLRSGLIRGVPLVFVAPGTWQERY